MAWLWYAAHFEVFFVVDIRLFSLGQTFYFKKTAQSSP